MAVGRAARARNRVDRPGATPTGRPALSFGRAGRPMTAAIRRSARHIRTRRQIHQRVPGGMGPATKSSVTTPQVCCVTREQRSSMVTSGEVVYG